MTTFIVSDRERELRDEMHENMRRGGNYRHYDGYRMGGGSYRNYEDGFRRGYESGYRDHDRDMLEQEEQYRRSRYGM